MSLSAPYTTSRSIGPFGYKHGHAHHHYQTVLPTSNSSMHLNLHKNVPDRIRPRSVHDNSRGILAGLKLLDKQKPQMRRFAGIKFGMKMKEQKMLSTRLASYNPLRFPAESRGVLPPIHQLSLCEKGKRTYSEMEVKRLVQRITESQKLSMEEIQGIVDRLSRVDDEKDGVPDTEETQPKKYSAAEVQKLVERLASYDPESWPADSRGKPARERDLNEIMGSRTRGKTGASSAEVNTIVERLSQFDRTKWPPGSRHKDEIGGGDGTRTREKAVGGGKTMTGGEIEEVVGRLTTYDKTRWPPESSGMKKPFYQGKPLKFRNNSTEQE